MIERSVQFTADGEEHRVYQRGRDVYVDHLEVEGGKDDVINLSKKHMAKNVLEGVKAVADYHSGRGPSYYS